MTDDRCGADDTTTGEPCKFTPGDSCPWHDTDDPPDTGRPTKLDLETQEIIAQAIEGGAGIAEAASKAGVHRETVGNWLEKAEEQEEGIYNDFFERFMRARGQNSELYRKALFELALETKDTSTLMAMMKQRNQADWGDVNRGEQSGGVVIYTDKPDEFEIDEKTLEAERKP